METGSLWGLLGKASPLHQTLDSAGGQVYAGDRGKIVQVSSCDNASNNLAGKVVVSWDACLV